MTGTLHVCAVPIGNLDDASPRLRRVLAEVDVIACEDTRVTRRLLDLLGVATDARLLAHHAHNEVASAAGLVALLTAGSDVAIVSDAGSPSVSDPGSALVSAAHAAGVQVVAVPGPSAVAAALGVAGLGGSGHRFIGFLPRADGELRAVLGEPGNEVLVAFESPQRLVRLLEVLAELQPTRTVVVCRELTKRFEQVARGSAAEVLEAVEDPVRGEVVVVLEPLSAAVLPEGVDAMAVALVRDLAADGMRTKVASRLVARHLGGSASALFDAANGVD